VNLVIWLAGYLVIGSSYPVIAAGTDVSGVIRDVSGRPISQARVSLMRVDDGPLPKPGGKQTHTLVELETQRTSAAGAFSFPRVSNGRYQLLIARDRNWMIADGLVITQSRDGHIVNHDGFRIDRHLGETPEGAAAIWPMGYRVSPAVEQATFRFATTVQAPRYAGVPMLSGFLAYYAVAAGLPDHATQLLESGYADFIDEPFLETDEFTKLRTDLPRAAPMFANIGAYVMTLIYGYPGIRVGPGDPASWCERPVVMPPGWRSIEIERIWARGTAWSLEARRGAAAANLIPNAGAAGPGPT